MRWLIPVGLMVAILAIGASAAGLGSGQPAPAHAQTTFDVDLVVGWNLVSWLGEDAGAEEALGNAAGSVRSVNTFDAGSQSFETFTSGEPAFLNSLTAIPTGAGVWLLSERAATWSQPRLDGARSVPLVTGFNLVAWTGSDDTPVADAVASLGGALQSIFLWEATAERFLTYGPSAPDLLNSAEVLNYGDGLWALMNAPVTWEQPAATPSVIVPPTDPPETEPADAVNCETEIDEGVPEFYSRYFRCVQIEVVGDSLRISSDGQPPHASFYYGDGHPLFEEFDFSRGDDFRPNPNTIDGTVFTVRIPLAPVASGISIDATTVNGTTGDLTDIPLGVAGVALDGIALFNGLAAPGEDIAEERFTFDSFGGHPTRDGRYHYHSVANGPLAVLQTLGFATTAVPGAAEIELYGIMCDGTVVMGLVELDGSPAAAGLDAQAGHVHDIVDGDGTVLLANRYHVHMAPEIGSDPRGLTPEARFYGECTIS